MYLTVHFVLVGGALRWCPTAHQTKVSLSNQVASMKDIGKLSEKKTYAPPLLDPYTSLTKKEIYDKYVYHIDV